MNIYLNPIYDFEINIKYYVYYITWSLVKSNIKFNPLCLTQRILTINNSQ
jgi:hypothetical protein